MTLTQRQFYGLGLGSTIDHSIKAPLVFLKYNHGRYSQGSHDF